MHRESSNKAAPTNLDIGADYPHTLVATFLCYVHLGFSMLILIWPLVQFCNIVAHIGADVSLDFGPMTPRTLCTFVFGAGILVLVLKFSTCLQQMGSRDIEISKVACHRRWLHVHVCVYRYAKSILYLIDRQIDS